MGIRTRQSRITRRWFFGTLLWIIIVLAVADIAVVSFVRNSYYSNAQQAVDWRVSNFVHNLPSTALETRERVSLVRQSVEEFSEKDKFELMLVSNSGRITATSSGFAASGVDKPADYLSALENADGYGVYIGYSTQNERIVAITQLLPTPIGEISAIRFVTSLQKVDEQISDIAVLITLVVVAIVFFTLLSGLYFIRSIVIPIQKIGSSAKDIASGNFDVRLEVDTNDEIGELCEQINEMAQGLGEADRVKNEFISSVSHELRTPLTSIRGWGETLAQVGASDERTFRKGMRIILDETQRLSVMVEDLLDFSRLQTGKLTVELKPLDLVAELGDALMVIEQRARRGGITINYQEPQHVIPIMGDSNRLRQVFGNILDNALKYSVSGGSIDIAVRVDGRCATVDIADHGRGVPANEVAKLTQRFYRASNAVTGSGIGLAVVNEIMQLHGGALGIKSELGKGTCMSLTFNMIPEEKEKQ